MKLKNTYYLLRHGEASSNEFNFVSCWPEKIHNPLTLNGINKVRRVARLLKKEKIDLIFSSDLLRAKQTAEIVAKELGLKIKFDPKIRESKFGRINGKAGKEWKKYLDTIRQRPPQKFHKEENYRDIRTRAENYLRVIEKKYEHKKILIISHGAVLFSLESIMRNISEKDERKYEKKLKFKNAELRKIK